MLHKEASHTWECLLQVLQKKCSPVEFQNWISPIQLLDATDVEIIVKVPNVFVQEYLLTNYTKELALFLPLNNQGKPNIRFVIHEPKHKKTHDLLQEPLSSSSSQGDKNRLSFSLNQNYTFAQFIEGPSNQFVKSAALGVANRPGKSYNPLFIHGGVGLGKTHLLHSIGHYIQEHHKRIHIHCITTEQFINDLVNNLKNKSIEQWKTFYRRLDVLLLDDIPFLENRLNFEEEFCHTFETLIHQNKQIVITSDKPPNALKLSERLIGRMEWGLVAKISSPDLETKVAILQHKAEQRGFHLSQSVAFFIAENGFHNVRQLEGAINRLCAHCNLTSTEITRESATVILSELFYHIPKKQITIESILKSVAATFNVQIQDLKSTTRKKEVAFPRQIVMYLAKELLQDSFIKASHSLGKTRSTILHSWNKIKKQLDTNDILKQKIQLTKQNLDQEKTDI